MTTPAAESPTTNAMVEDLERMRARLLDLSARNPLLSYRHPRASSLRVVNEVPALVLERMVSNGRFQFTPLPDDEDAGPLFEQPEGGVDDLTASPSAVASQSATAATRAKKDAARQKAAQRAGINPSFDLPAVGDAEDAAFNDRHLQTLLFDEELEARLQKMQAAAVTAIQETGANLLHMLFGFVEWTDTEGGQPRMAPLTLLPVYLTRMELDHKTHTYPYGVAASGEDWATNLTLQEKCRREFGFDLPSIEDEENLEVYFTRVQAVLDVCTKGWKVRRQITLGLVSFGKLLMWRDLNHQTWPSQKGLLTNPLLRQVLGEGVAQDVEKDRTDLLSNEYDIDRLDRALLPVPPVVMLADSSQHSVLVDVQQGKNLCVIGPPGTGKSQTITQLIAGALAAKKRVLFVAEKKAALDVVYRRLNDVGLGHFCLALHSHTSNKREFLDNLKARIDLQVPVNPPPTFPTVARQLVDARRQLTSHVDRLHTPHGKMETSAFTLLWRVRRLASELGEDTLAQLRDITYPGVKDASRQDLKLARARVEALAATAEPVLADFPDLTTHPWYGLTRVDLTFDSIQVAAGRVRSLIAALDAAQLACHSLDAEIAEIQWPRDPLTLGALLSRCAALSSPPAMVPPVVIAGARAIGCEATELACQAAEAAATAWRNVEGPWGAPGALSAEDANRFSVALTAATKQFGAEITTSAIAALGTILDRALQQLVAVERLAAELRPGHEWSVQSAAQLIVVAHAAGAVVPGGFDLRTPALEGAGAGERVQSLVARASALRTADARLDASFPSALRGSMADLKEMAMALSDAPSFLPSLFSGAYRKAVKAYRRMHAGVAARRATMLTDVHLLISHNSALETFAKSPEVTAFFGERARGLECPFDILSSVSTWALESVAALRAMGSDGRLLVDAVWQDSADAWQQAARVADSDTEGLEAATELAKSMAVLGETVQANAKVWTAASTARVREQWTAWRALVTDIADIAASAKTDPQAPLHELVRRLDAVLKVWDADAKMHAHTAFDVLQIPVPRHGLEAGDAIRQMREALAYVRQFDAPEFPPPLIEMLTSDGMANRLAALLREVPSVQTAVDAAVSAEKALIEAGAIDLSRWYLGRTGAPDRVSFADRRDRAAVAISAERLLPPLQAYLRARGQVLSSPVPVAVAVLDAGVLPYKQLPDVVDFVAAYSMVMQAFRDIPELEKFSGAVHNVVRHDFTKFDAKYIALTQQAIRTMANSVQVPSGVAYGPVKDLTEFALVKHEIEKTRRHVPIREMFRRAGRAIQALKPVVMMGPQAVAQFLPPGLFEFDVVVFDEASQMRPEDALGAIARGHQLVVVGDQKQLGPTSFFDRASMDEEDDMEEAAAQLMATQPEAEAKRGATVLERSESILQAVSQRYPTRMLRWHYRSRYPDLIRFSNAEFYGDGLILFPHPGHEKSGDGVNFCFVEKALYASNVNVVEAQAVVAAVQKHAVEHPERSLLVATMNQKQRELIDGLLQRAEKDDPALAAFRARYADTPEPLDIKNLENVQGDERDVIVVSVTYGPNSAGQVYQGFGPINSAGGERRLNVLFTRAKFRLDVYCSFDPTVLRVTEDSPRGLVVLRDYLRFAKEGSLSTGRFTARAPDSDFEIEVARAISVHGFDVHTQVGVAGYFLDMAVVDPKHPGRYCLAIEADGATYHSAKSARDRDRLRQGVLEGLGWEIHRIWSTDWFRDPQGEVKKVLRRLDSLGVVAGTQPPNVSPPAVS